MNGSIRSISINKPINPKVATDIKPEISRPLNAVYKNQLKVEKESISDKN